MKNGFTFGLVVLGIVLLSLTACSKRDKTISVEDDNAEMNAAIAKARETLPQFWQVFAKPERGESDFALKVKITDSNGTEHFWANEIKREDGKITATINNDPNIVKTVKLGSRIELPEGDISDWMYMRDGKMVGNHTLKPLLKHMSDDDVDKLKSLMADP